MKFSWAQVQKTEHSDYFEADLDSFKGNSGGPVMIWYDKEKTLEVAGILSSSKHLSWAVNPDYYGTGVKKVFARHVTEEEKRKKGSHHCQRVA